MGWVYAVTINGVPNLTDAARQAEQAAASMMAISGYRMTAPLAVEEFREGDDLFAASAYRFSAPIQPTTEGKPA